MLLEMNPFSSLLTGWGLMVVAMMLPKLIAPIQHIYHSSFKYHRFLSILLFTFGYITVWIVAGVFIITVILGLHMLVPNSYVPAIGFGCIAIVWQFSPAKQRCLNRGHDHWRLTAFGWPAYRDALMFGLMHGVWCIGAGWALMLFPMLLPEGHNLAMIVMTFIMLSEHLEHPQVPRWRIDSRAKLLRIIVAQTQLKLKRIRRMS
jgi:predicted metal-binding membrane protein